MHADLIYASQETLWPFVSLVKPDNLGARETKLPGFFVPEQIRAYEDRKTVCCVPNDTRLDAEQLGHEDITGGKQKTHPLSKSSTFQMTYRVTTYPATASFV